MAVRAGPDLIQWRRISESPEQEPALIFVGKDYYHEYHFAPASGKLYRCLSDSLNPYWHVADGEHTCRVFCEDAPFDGEYSQEAGWVADAK